jgi:hypothetical protein
MPKTKKKPAKGAVKKSVTKTTCAEHPYTIGECYLIRTVTAYQTGRLVAVYQHELVLEDAAWIADTGRFHKALADGTLNEIEPAPNGRVFVGRGAIVDVFPWKHPLPRETK